MGLRIDQWKKRYYMVAAVSRVEPCLADVLPVVMVVAIYGVLYAGLLATVLVQNERSRGMTSPSGFVGSPMSDKTFLINREKLIGPWRYRI
jgi:hypothetical protein